MYERFGRFYSDVCLGTRLLSQRLTFRRQNIRFDERLKAFNEYSLPLQKEALVRWNEQLVPYISCASEADLALTFGAVHAHLRGFQLELMRRLAYGTVAEVLGHRAVPVDHTLRIIDFPRRTNEILAAMPQESRSWIESFVQGVNAVIEQCSSPEEFQVLGFQPRAWTAGDVVAVSKLSGMDFSWRVWSRLIGLRQRPDWLNVWNQLIETALRGGSASETADDPNSFAAAWHSLERSGSNAFALAGEKTVSGGAILSSDPHLSLMLPANWLMASLSCPTLQACGLAIPGIPLITLGRNMNVGWCGTSLHAASSDLIQVDDAELTNISERNESIHIRGAKPRTVRVRESVHGPLISDAPLAENYFSSPVALIWIGHRSGDELSALYQAMKAENRHALRESFKPYGAPALNLIYGDREGAVGRFMAAHLPERSHDVPADMILGEQDAKAWESIIDSSRLPASHAPGQGFVASANERPSDDFHIPVGYFFSAGARINRLRRMISRSERLDLSLCTQLHADVAIPEALNIRDVLVSIVDVPMDDFDRTECSRRQRLVRSLKLWDGRYSIRSSGALAFELTFYYFLAEAAGEDALPVYAATYHPWELFLREFEEFPFETLVAHGQRALGRAAPVFEQYQEWGAAHRLRLNHPFASLPLIGKKYSFIDIPVGGSNETLMKTASGLSGTRHPVRFGANARFLCDLSDPDENYAVLLGGQDGLPGSAAFADQVELWQRGEYCVLPLTEDGARRCYPYRSVLPARLA